LETVRKRKVTPAPETTETVTSGTIIIEAPVIEEIVVTETIADVPAISRDAFNAVLAESPPLFGHSPTVQQIEDFKQKEYAWRTKLNSL